MGSNERSLKDELEDHREEVRRIVDDTARDVVAEVQNAAGEALSRVGEKVSRLSTAARVGVGLGAVVASVAVLAALQADRSRADRRRPMVFHLEPGPDGGWRLSLEGEEGVLAAFDTKKEGLAVARDLASERAPSELVVHRADGSEQDRHEYPG